GGRTGRGCPRRSRRNYTRQATTSAFFLHFGFAPGLLGQLPLADLAEICLCHLEELTMPTLLAASLDLHVVFLHFQSHQLGVPVGGRAAPTFLSPLLEEMGDNYLE